MALLPANADAALSTLWRTVSSEPGRVTRKKLHDVAKEVGQVARAADFRPEELVVAIKDSWTSQNGELHRWNKRSSVERVVDDVISFAIEEFFATP
jgi:hypothetical protein